MLNFSEDFFKNEIKWDYPVGELRKRAWAAQLEVLQTIIDLCERHQLTWYVYWGTLLGTVRHKGFIPWDDDIDIALKRDDYIKLLEIAEDELPQGYRVLNAYTEPRWENYFSRIINRQIVDLSASGMKESHGFPFRAGIDVFPLYYIPRDKAQAELQKQLLEMASQLLGIVEYQAEHEKQEDPQELQEITENVRGGIALLEQRTGFKVDESKPCYNQLLILYDQICRFYREEESRGVTAFLIYMRNGYEVEPELLKESVNLPFENIMVKAPKGYDDILRKTFRNYMIPVRGGSTHEGVFFRDDMEVLEKHIHKLAHEDLRADPALEGRREQEIRKWGEKIRDRKIILFCTTMTEMFGNDGFAIDKMKYVLDTFRDREEILLWWRPCILDTPSACFLEKMVPCFLREYRELIEEYRELGFGILDETENVSRAVESCDAYYGDPGETAELFAKTGKPMMYQDYEIL